MNELSLKSEKEKEYEALVYWGKAYVKLPRVILRMLFSNDPSENETGRIYFVLFAKASYSTGRMIWGGMEIDICRGEYICSYGRLSEITGIKYSTLRSRLMLMQEKGLIRITRIKDGIRIYLFGYDRYTAVVENRETEKLTPFQQMTAYEERLRNGITY